MTDPLATVLLAAIFCYGFLRFVELATAHIERMEALKRREP